MKYLFIIAVVLSLLFSSMLFSQESTTTVGGGGGSFNNKATTATVPNKISYQGMLTTAVIILSLSYSMQFLQDRVCGTKHKPVFQFNEEHLILF
jgi:hypothetical protein